ncbi:MAG: hypothetical protein IPM56_18310 [Ignavibacteriales bacterium]|nr:MAG: hypothetical protein IPM56_18310 [Ignavibacteriales bacterium]
MKTKTKIVFAAAVLLFVSVIVLVIMSFSGSHGIDAKTEGVIVENNFSDQSGQTEAITEISFHYSEPQNIYGTDYSMMRVIAQGLDESSELYKRGKYDYPYVVNILFYNLSKDNFRLLFNRKVLILESLSRYTHIDSSTSRLFFTVVNKDNNEDGYLNEEDNHILFSTDRIGDNLFQITSADENVESYIFLGNDKVLITVTTPEKEKPRETWKWKYLLYDLKSNDVNPKNRFNSSLQDAWNLFWK